MLVLAGAPSPGGHVEADVRAQLARQCGVPRDAILTVPDGRTTLEEAAAMSRVLLPLGIEAVLLVADSEGMGRAARVFERHGFEVAPAPTADVLTSGSPEDNLDLIRRVLIEGLAHLYYRVAGYI